MAEPFFSIIVPVYNAETYLEACVDSVLTQDFEDLEIILLDDGSKDSSGSICDRLQRQHPDTIRAFHQPNAGVYTARCRLAGLAEGKYILSLDADDCLAAGCLSTLAALAASSEPDMIMFRYQRMDEHGHTIADSDSEKLFDEGPVSPDDLFRLMAYNESVNSLCVKLVRRTLFEHVRMQPEYSRVRNGEDLFISIPLLSHAESIYYYPAALYRYRVNLASTTWNFHEDQDQYILIVRPYVMEQIRMRGLDTPDIVSGYYRLYLLRIWVYLVMMAEDKAYSRSASLAVMKRLSASADVRSARERLSSSSLSSAQREILRLLFRGRIRMSLLALRGWVILQRAIGKITGRTQQ